MRLEKRVVKGVELVIDTKTNRIIASTLVIPQPAEAKADFLRFERIVRDSQRQRAQQQSWDSRKINDLWGAQVNYY